MNRVILVHTPLVGNTLLFKSLVGHEKLSELYAFEVELLSTINSVNLRELLGKTLTIEMRSPILPSRFLNGYITRMTLVGRESSGERYYIYRATVQPGLWYLTQNRDFRIWQEKTVPEIISSILSDYQIQLENKLSWSYRQWGYCVQYQESDFDFISRLMEHEGIYYYFRHEMGNHTLVLADEPQAHTKLEGYEFIPYLLTETEESAHTNGIQSWSVSDAITPSLYSLDDYDFRKPRARLLETRQNPTSFAGDKAEVFDWPGHFTDRDHGQFYVRVRQQEFEAQHEKMTGHGSTLGIAPGHTFTLSNAPRVEDQREYLTVEARYFLTESSYSSGDQGSCEHRTEFTVVPSNINWRPSRITSWPKTHGPQTAEVVGPEGQPIWTDKYGRVKLKFRWDRHGKGDDSGSCWIRVSSSWAGWKYGGVQIPRVGEEVVVDFINGDPDRPLITGRVYNEDSMPPWDLPNDATKMGFMSRSTSGSADNASYLFFEDAPGRESFDMHAEDQMNISVEGNQNITIDGTRTTHIGGQQIDSVMGDASFHYDSKRDITVEDLETNTFINGQKVEIDEGREFTIKSGGDTVKITGDIDRTFDGNVTETTTKNFYPTVNGNIVKKTDGTIAETTEGKFTETFNNGLDTTVTAGGKTETIDGGLTVNVNSGDWVQNVNNGVINIYSPNEITIKSDVKVTIDVPYFASRAADHKESFTGNSLSFTGASESFTGGSATFNGLGISMSGTSISWTPLSVSTSLASIVTKPMNYTRSLNKIENSIQNTVLSVLHLFM
ncbi:MULTISPECIES: type VI secretion system Vgr family protein [unclassified Serratia (in: enterobacteria)]|uniref:type VI secretion system Vgr family protein n=1 Tax=unclassified Serratia (in: enterobacteria) TaxID=2647522 RepID=UPI000502462F|nr:MULTISPECIES: type VI secretion system tip protein TssI/VgrG [unclassified Serratia (in: enterobacteria)]KFK97921.1 ImpA family type VI secretion-associated protein [Serratia sp. Ag2]KFL00312.1 ImpA family type VI secretion-associated protein [Serratia sp. Ag1]